MNQVGEFKKLDSGKPRPDLLPPNATLEVSRVLAFGAAKYGASNWNQAELEDGRARYVAAAMRHVLAYQCGEQIDDESGLNHLAHAVTSLLFVLERDIVEGGQ